MGTSFTCTMQSFKCKKNQRLFTSSGLASMGYGIPGSIGASFANKKNKIICISGDGSNVQYTRVTNNCSSSTTNKDFILNNEGYLTMKLMQKKFLNITSVLIVKVVSVVQILYISKIFGLKSMLLNNGKKIESKIRKFYYLINRVMPNRHAIRTGAYSKFKLKSVKRTVFANRLRRYVSIFR